jgi:hypothetical protein
MGLCAGSAIITEFADLAQALSALPEMIEAGAPQTAADPATLAELESLLTLSDTRAERLAAERAPPLRAGLGARFDKARQLIQRFDYDGALELLRAARGA